MNSANRIIIKRLGLKVVQAFKILEQEKIQVSNSSGKAGETPGGTALAASVGQAVVAQIPLRYAAGEYKDRLLDARNTQDYGEAIQLIEEAVKAKLTFLTDERTRRDIESIVRGLKESGDVQGAVILATFCFRNKINYETRPNAITTKTVIVSGQKECPVETAHLMSSAIENGLIFEEKMIMTTAVHVNEKRKPENSVAYGGLVLAAVKNKQLKDSKFVETVMARLANPQMQEEENNDDDICQRAEFAYQIAAEYLDKGLPIIDKTRIDKTRIDKIIHDLRRIPKQILNACRLLLKAFKCEGLDISPITVESTISTVSSTRENLSLDKKLGELLYKVISAALEKYERDTFNWETFDVLCQVLMKSDETKVFALQIAVKCAESGYILRARTYDNIYNGTDGLQEVQKRRDLTQKREQLPDLIKIGHETTIEKPVERTDLRGGL